MMTRNLVGSSPVAEYKKEMMMSSFALLDSLAYLYNS